jgi:hypothetical protein
MASDFRFNVVQSRAVQPFTDIPVGALRYMRLLIISAHSEPFLEVLNAIHRCGNCEGESIGR